MSVYLKGKNPEPVCAFKWQVGHAFSSIDEESIFVIYIFHFMNEYENIGGDVIKFWGKGIPGPQVPA